jgi:MFS family permease
MLLTRFAFADYAFLLMVFQGIILVVVPPLAGMAGDRFRSRQGHRLSIISTGISLAAMIFMAVAFTLFGSPGELFRWILPLLIVAWLIAMSIFTSPALSTLELFAPVEKLPRAMAVLTIVANLIYAIEPVIVDIIDFLGAPVTFMVGGIAVFVSGYTLKTNSFSLITEKGKGNERFLGAAVPSHRRSKLIDIFLLGVALGVPTTVMFNVFPELLNVQHVSLTSVINGNVLLVLVLSLSALFSIPASHFVEKIGLKQSFWVSLVIAIFSAFILVVTSGLWPAVIMLVLFSLSFSALSVSALPLTMRWSSYNNKVFCVGLFFSGVALPNGILEALQAW